MRIQVWTNQKESDRGDFSAVWRVGHLAVLIVILVNIATLNLELKRNNRIV